MNNSASRYTGFSTEQAQDQTQPGLVPPMILRRAWRSGAAAQLQNIPVQARPLLAIQRMTFQAEPVMCVCNDARAAQRYFCEATSAILPGPQQAFLLHDQMPAYQQEFVLECLRGTGTGVECETGTDKEQDPALLVITADWYRRLVAAADPIVEAFQVVDVRGGASAQTASAAADDPTVLCICLRKGPGGRWLLMDHNDAAVVSAAAAPTDDMIARLLSHVVPISGRQLAPYLAMMFDVPHAWKISPELAACALLIFENDECPTGCNLPGIPAKLIWNDVLGIVCAG